MTADEFAAALLEAHNAGAPYPRASEHFEDLSLTGAYEIQKRFVSLLADQGEVLGYKGALTAAPAQKNMGIDRPVTGALFVRAGYDGSLRVPSAAFGRLMLETELSFRLGRDINEPLNSVEEAAAAVAGVAPAIELANLSFDAPPAGADLVAANAAFGSYIRGEEWQPGDVDTVPASLSRGDDVLHQGVSGDVLGGQWLAVHWLVNSILECGYELRKGHILLTGSIGALQPGEPGDYVADFGEGGRISFSVT